MPSRQLIPRIRIDLLDGSPRSLSSSTTLDIRDILGQAKLLPKLLAEDAVFNDANDALEDSHFQDAPPFPDGHKPPIFILNSHRARLPFPIRPEAFELGDFCRDEEDACPLLTAPTIPRMKLMMEEQLYVQEWVDTLTSDNPPKHIPWTCEKPAAERKWIAEGSIFPVDVIKSSAEQRQTTRQHSGSTNTNKNLALGDRLLRSGDLRAFLQASAPIHAPMGSHTLASHVLVKPADIDPAILRREKKTFNIAPSQIPHCIVRTSQAPSPPGSLPFVSPIGTASTTSQVPLAARRGRLLSGLMLKGNVIEQLEYPDIPTAFRGSPSVWSPRFDAFPVPTFTDHQNMLLDLKLKCAGLGSGVSTYIQEPREENCLQPQTEMTSLGDDEWTFTRALAGFENNFWGSFDTQVPGEVIADTSIFLPDDCSRPAKGPSFTARLDFAPCLHSSTPALQSSGNGSGDPPGVPLPPRPALVNPSTLPHVRGILKKAKIVRFEDMIAKEPQKHASTNGSPPQASPERPSPLPLVIPSERPCTPIRHTAKTSKGPPKVKDTEEMEMPMSKRISREKRSAPRPRLAPKRTKVNGEPEPLLGNAEPSKAALTTSSVERPCRIAHVKENTNPPAVSQAQGKPRAFSVSETDVRRGLESSPKSRLSTPLRNIFRFR